jgi:DNA segregation ATPase FtsK/SpoIIIE, S-DNA-T family
LIGCAVAALVIWWCYWPGSFTRWVAAPARGKWRAWWCYRRRWEAVMNVADLAPWYRGRILMPVLGRVTATKYTDLVAVRLVSGQCAGRPGRSALRGAV